MTAPERGIDADLRKSTSRIGRRSEKVKSDGKLPRDVLEIRNLNIPLYGLKTDRRRKQQRWIWVGAALFLAVMLIGYATKSEAEGFYECGESHFDEAMRSDMQERVTSQLALSCASSGSK